KYAYVAFGLYGLEIIDISNPSSPTLVGSYKPETKYYGMSVTNTVTSVTGTLPVLGNITVSSFFI
ncbi:MAG: hypothetical protein ACKPJF_09395, partial [Dolichospermum sp.]